MWILRTMVEGAEEQTFRILPGNARTIGRAAGADFIVDAALVSRVHCRLTALPSGELEVKDLDSTNGTFLNGTRVARARVAPGDRIQVGRVELVALREGADTGHGQTGHGDSEARSTETSKS
jgi:pSer/pThr/pTyr-binding forkhead associated (FHA) protein